MPLQLVAENLLKQVAASVEAARLAHSTDSLAATSSTSAGSGSSSGAGHSWAGVFFGGGGETVGGQGGSGGSTSSTSASGWSSEAVREMEAAGELYNRTREHTFEAKAVEESVRLLR